MAPARHGGCNLGRLVIVCPGGVANNLRNFKTRILIPKGETLFKKISRPVIMCSLLLVLSACAAPAPAPTAAPTYNVPAPHTEPAPPPPPRHAPAQSRTLSDQ